MTQNRSSAVMQQRHEPHGSLDDFPTPPWATRALCEYLIAQGFNLSTMSCREPAANRGYMVRPLREYFASVYPSDIFDYGLGYEVEDYLFHNQFLSDFTITNPPFRLASEFIHQMRKSSKIGYAVLVRLAFLETYPRYRDLFSVNPPTYIYQFCERVIIHKGKIASQKESTATSYVWIIWLNIPPRKNNTEFVWSGQCRDVLIRAGDYDDYEHKTGGLQ